ncbi:MAG: MarR family transcriptional regulator [Acidimicrobiales bacterium]
MSSNLLADVERALEQLFRLGANRRFDARQEEAVGAAVTRAGYAVLRCLSSSDGMGVAALAEACAMDAATASRQVDRLETDGLVVRRADENDGRAVSVTITPRGRAVYDAVVAYRLGYLTDALSEWQAGDLSTLSASIERLVGDLTRTPATDPKTPNRADPEVRPAKRG